MGVDNGRVTQVFQESFFGGKAAFKFNLDTRPVSPVPFDILRADNIRLVGLYFYLEKHLAGGCRSTCP